MGENEKLHLGSFPYHQFLDPAMCAPVIDRVKCQVYEAKNGQKSSSIASITQKFNLICHAELIVSSLMK